MQRAPERQAKEQRTDKQHVSAHENLRLMAKRNVDESRLTGETELEANANFKFLQSELRQQGTHKQTQATCAMKTDNTDLLQ